MYWSILFSCVKLEGFATVPVLHFLALRANRLLVQMVHQCFAALSLPPSDRVLPVTPNKRKKGEK